MTNTLDVMATIDFSTVNDRTIFHQISANIFGFPNFYGNNMHAWIDCMRSLRHPEEGLSKLTVSKNSLLNLELHGFIAFSERQPELSLSILLSIGIVNRDCFDADGKALILHFIS